MSIGPKLGRISGATGATSRVIGFAASVVLLAFAFSPKLSDFFLLVPQEVAGSLLVFTASFMISGGMQDVGNRPGEYPLALGCDGDCTHDAVIAPALHLLDDRLPLRTDEDGLRSTSKPTCAPLAIYLKWRVNKVGADPKRP
jgi:hypothetical protein